MRGVSKYIVEVDLRAADTMKIGDVEIITRDIEGDMYQNKPFHGTLIAAPSDRDWETMRS